MWLTQINKTHLQISAVMLTVFFLGCQVDPRAQRETSLLRAEILDLEDQYYSMRSRYRTAVRDLRECRGEAIDAPIDGLDDLGFQDTAIGSGIVIDPGTIIEGECYDCDPIITSGQPNIVYEGPGGQAPTMAPTTLPGQPYSVDVNQMNPNGIEMNAPAQNGPATNSVREQLPATAPDDSTTSRRRSNTSDSQLSFTLEDDLVGQQVGFQGGITEIRINPKFTRAANVDGRPGDDGLKLLVQPRSAKRGPVMVPGALAVNLIDAKSSRQNRIVGSWKFTAEEMELFATGETGTEPGYLLRLPWVNNIPRNKRLRIQVRYVAPQGQTLETSAEVNVEPPGEDYSADAPLIAGWTLRGSDIVVGMSEPEIINSDRRKIKAIPASTGRRIKRRGWRPVR